MHDYQFLHAPRALERAYYTDTRTLTHAHHTQLAQYSTVHHTHYLKAATPVSIVSLVEDYKNIYMYIVIKKIYKKEKKEKVNGGIGD